LFSLSEGKKGGGALRTTKKGKMQREEEKKKAAMGAGSEKGKKTFLVRNKGKKSSKEKPIHPHSSVWAKKGGGKGNFKEKKGGAGFFLRGGQ